MKTARPRTTIVFVGLILLTLSAGVVAGMLVKRFASLAPERGTDVVESGTLSDQLQLTTEQKNQLRTIWESASDDVKDCYRQVQDIQKRRDQAIVKILTEQQKIEFEKIAKRYSEEYIRLTENRERTFNQAVERHRALLDAKQRVKYDAILKSRLGKLPAASAHAVEIDPLADAQAGLN